MTYTPNYDTTIRTTTEVHSHNTWHRDGIDWDYPFDDPKHTSCMCCNDERKHENIEKKKAWLKLCEQGGDVYVSNYGGLPRIWKKVISVGMASCWPYWEPRPVVMIYGTLGTEWYDWNSLTGAEKR